MLLNLSANVQGYLTLNLMLELPYFISGTRIINQVPQEKNYL